MLKEVITVTLMVVIAVLFYMAGLQAAPIKYVWQVKYLTNTVYITKPIESVRVVVREVVKTVYADRDEFREFEDIEDLRFWLNRTGINQREYIPDEYDCEDFAIDLAKMALKDGYWVGLVDDGEHIYNFTIIGNRIYWIEPQSNQKDIQIRRYGQLD